MRKKVTTSVLAFAKIMGSLVGCAVPATPPTAPPTKYIWPNPKFVDLVDNPAIPKVESLKTCIAKYGPNDWRTWRAEYFEWRLKIPDDPYRYEHSSFRDVFERGAECNIWTGFHKGIWGLTDDQSVWNIWPGAGMRSQAICTAGLHPGEGCDIHSDFITEIVYRVLRGSGEFYLNDHWIEVTRYDVLWAPMGVPTAFRCPEGNKEDMLVLVYMNAVPMGVLAKAGMIEVDHSAEAKAKGWAAVWKFTHPEEYGLKGELVYPPR